MKSAFRYMQFINQLTVRMALRTEQLRFSNHRGGVHTLIIPELEIECKEGIINWVEEEVCHRFREGLFWLASRRLYQTR